MVTAKFGANVTVGGRHDYGIDMTVSEVQILPNNKREEAGFTFKVQLKATIDWERRGDKIIYDLDADAFNKMGRQNTNPHSCPTILVLMCLPKLEKDWIHTNLQRMMVKNCCYWQYINSLTTNTGTKRLFIPTRSAFNSQAVGEIFDQIANGVIV